jgi:hypothetical protein
MPASRKGTDMHNYIGHDFGFVSRPIKDEDHQRIIDVLSVLVAREKFDSMGETAAREAIARRDKKAMLRLIRTATTTRELQP